MHAGADFPIQPTTSSSGLGLASWPRQPRFDSWCGQFDCSANLVGTHLSALLANPQFIVDLTYTHVYAHICLFSNSANKSPVAELARCKSSRSALPTIEDATIRSTWRAKPNETIPCIVRQTRSQIQPKNNTEAKDAGTPILSQRDVDFIDATKLG